MLLHRRDCSVCPYIRSALLVISQSRIQRFEELLGLDEKLDGLPLPRGKMPLPFAADSWALNTSLSLPLLTFSSEGAIFMR